MKSNLKKVATIRDYFSSVPKESKNILTKIESTIKSVAPKATEKIAYQIPSFYFQGHPLVGYAAFKDHFSFFVMSYKVMNEFKEETKNYKKAVGTIQFTKDNPLPAPLIKKIVKARLKEIQAKYSTNLDKYSFTFSS